MPNDTKLQQLPLRTPKTVSIRSAIAGAVILVGIGFALGFTAGADGAENGGPLGATLPPPGVDFSPVWKAWYTIDEKFVPASVATTTENASSTAEEKSQERVWGLIQGLAGSLGDPYTYFLPPVEAEEFEESMSGKFEGVGMEIALKDGVVTVVAPLKGNPAEKAGIQSGDKVLKIDGKDTAGLDVESAVRQIRGPKGTQVILTIGREGWSEPRDITVTRDVINVPIIETELRSDGVFVIRVISFTANAPQLFREALREFVESKSSKLVLDLRGNPGGYLEAAVDMASWFLPSGRIVVTEDYAGNQDSIVSRSRGYNVFNKNLKMVILVDKGSASASEIMAGALRYYDIGKLVGTKTFGKGSVQELVDITPETSLKITVARWLTPSNEPIPTDGIKPDVEVEITEEDRKGGRDPQMEKAVEILEK